MTDPKEVSNLSLSRVECSHCGAVWINGQHIWATGAITHNSEIDLNGLVCSTPHGDAAKCVNPKKGEEGGDTWEARMKYINLLHQESEKE